MRNKQKKTTPLSIIEQGKAQSRRLIQGVFI
jgi:hypothetical protein